MDENEALKILEAMPEADFQAFYATLPARVQLLVKSGACDWKQVLPQWYIKKVHLKVPETAFVGINPDDIPF